MTTPELLPCPFCGGHASLVSPAMGRPYVCCDDNFCTGPKPSADQAIAAWNTRAPLSPAVLGELKGHEQR
jgi:Restriction alleviation protein Lar